MSFDDDVPELFCKIREGTTQDTLQPLPPGALECVIHHARDLMHEQGAYIWGFSPSANPMNMRRTHISRRNGMVNGFAYGYLNRHSNEFRSVYGSPTEDVERSCRFFNADRHSAEIFYAPGCSLGAIFIFVFLRLSATYWGPKGLGGTAPGLSSRQLGGSTCSTIRHRKLGILGVRGWVGNP